MAKGNRTALLAVATAAALRLPLALAGPDAQLGLLPDDASYYMEAARRTVETGSWPTMDGRHLTNGFHPAYFLLQAGLQAWAGTDPRRAVPLTLIVSLLLNVAAVWLLARAALKREGGFAGAMACVAFALSPGWLAQGLSGMETALSAPLLLMAATRWWERFGGGTRRSGGFATDGLLLGLAVSARSDSVFFAALDLGTAFAILLRETGLRRAIREVAPGVAVLFLCVAPWLALGYSRFGTLQQDSAAAIAVRFERLCGGRLSAGGLALIGKDLAFWGYRLSWVWGLMPLTGWLCGRILPTVRSRLAERFGRVDWLLVPLCLAALAIRQNDPWYIHSPRWAAVEMGLAALGFVGGLLSPRGGPALPARVVGLLASFVVLVALAYSTVLLGFQLWYTAGPALTGVGLLTAPELARMVRGRRALAFALVGLVGVQGVSRVRSYLDRGAFEGLTPDLLARGDDLRRRLEAAAARSPHMRFGCFDSGELSYRVHPFPVTNLDGVMNHDASLAIRENALGSYLLQDGVTHIIGTNERIAEFQRVSRFEVVPDPQLQEALGALVFRVVPTRKPHAFPAAP